jgi:transcriptional regulator with XRE-family HTH domain
MDNAASPRLEAGTLVSLLRRRRGWSQRQLSHAVGRSPAYLSKVEAGEIDPSLAAFAAIAVALGMNPFEVWTLLRVANKKEEVTKSD